MPDVLKHFWKVFKKKLEVCYLGNEMTPTPEILRPYKALMERVRGLKMRNQNTTKNILKMTAKTTLFRLVHGPVLNLCFAGIPFLIIVGVETYSQRKIQERDDNRGLREDKGPGNGVGRFKGVSKSVQKHRNGLKPEPLRLVAPENNVAVIVSEPEKELVSHKPSRPKGLEKTASLPMATFSDRAALRMYHALFLAGMRDSVAQDTARGVYDNRDIVDMVDDGTWEEGDLAAFLLWFQNCAVA